MVASKVTTLQNNSAHGEDSMLTRDLGNGDFLDVVMDGVTGHGGGEASRELTEILSEAEINTADDLAKLLKEINDDFYRVGEGRFLLTTVSAALYRSGHLSIVAAGDSPAFLVDGQSHKRLTGNAGGFLHVGVARAIGASGEMSELSRVEVDPPPGSRIVISTDGVTDNMNAEELADIVRTSATPEEAAERVEEIISGRLVEGRIPDTVGTRFRNDDRTAIFRFFD